MFSNTENGTVKINPTKVSISFNLEKMPTDQIVALIKSAQKELVQRGEEGSTPRMSTETL